MMTAPAPVQAPPAPTTRSPQVRVGSLWIDALSFDEALAAIGVLLDAGRGGSVFTPNVDHVVTAEHDAAFRSAYDSASLSLADGQALVWGSRVLGTPIPAKVSGSDLVWPLVALAACRGHSVYLLGGLPGAAEEAARRFVRELGARVVGVDESRIRVDACARGDDTVERVRAARPDLLLVGLGSPKQELWIHRALPLLPPTVAVGVGASLDFVAGRVRRAPRWVSRAGFEWLFRLHQEPRRLAHRYLVKDPRFAAVLVRTALTPRAARLRERPLDPAGSVRWIRPGMRAGS